MTLDAHLIVAHLRIAGALIAGLAVRNVFVPVRFGWREELSRVSLLNRQIFQVHTIFLIVTLALVSVLLLTCADALVEPTRLARAPVQHRHARPLLDALDLLRRCSGLRSISSFVPDPYCASASMRSAIACHAAVRLKAGLVSRMRTTAAKPIRYAGCGRPRVRQS